MAEQLIVIGGGVMGLLSARELAARGHHVIVVERGKMAGEASWAGGGIVSPLYPWRYNSAVSALARASQHDYPSLTSALAKESGVDPELRRKGLLMLAVEDADAALQWAAATGAAMSREPAAFVASLEPRVSSDDGALWMPEVSSVRNPRLGQALRGALARDPRITLLEGAEVCGWQQQGGQIVGVQLADRVLRGERYLLCSGAWSAQLLAPLGIDLPIAPVKGQMLLFRTSGELLNRVVLKNGRYLIPRADGRVLVGSTLEHSGFQKQLTAEAHDGLFRSALEILPALADQPLEAQWAGLRPGSPAGIPFIGAVPGFDNLFVNAGHFRNGLVLAPASCRLTAQLICDETPFLDPTPYALDAERGSELL